MASLLRFVAALLLAIPLFAADLGIHQNWPDSPQGWFMTKAERTRWATLASEADATQFIAEFLAKRNPKFADEVELRVKKANQYFTVGETQGAHALRGKVIILLGPPSAMDVALKKTRSGGRTGSIDTAMSAAASDRSGAGLADAAEVNQRSAMTANTPDKLYTITYAADQLPTKKPLTVILEVDGVTGRDKITDRKSLAELEKVFEAAAEASNMAHP